MPRRLLLAFGALAALSLPALAQDACSTTTEGTAALAAYPAVRAFYDALSTGNSDLVDCAVSSSWTNTPSAPGTPAGPEGFKPGVVGLRASFEQYAFTTQDVIVAADKVVVRSMVTARQSGDFLGIPGGGDPAMFQTIDIHQLDADGKIAASWHVEDWLSFLFQRGALPLSR